MTKRYAVDYTQAAAKALSKLDKQVASMIYDWIGANLVGCSNARAHGKALAGGLSGQWRYRVGDYRLIAQIHDDTVTILMLAIGHRSKIYDEP